MSSYLLLTRHGVNSVPELELNGNSNSRIGTAFKKEMELINLELKFAGIPSSYSE